MDLRLAEGSSSLATDRAVQRLEALLAKEPGVENYVAYLGSGNPRCYLPLDQQLTQTHFA